MTDPVSQALSVLAEDERLLIACLDVLEVPIWSARPNPNYDPDNKTSGPEFFRKRDWQKVSSQDNDARLSQFRPRDCLCANGCSALTFFDIDTKNGGDPEQLRTTLDDLGVRIFAEIITPSGGVHDYVHSTWNMPGARVWDTPVLKGVDVQVRGRNVFLPGTIRQKYDKGYQIAFNHLPELIEARQQLKDRFEQGVAALGPIPPENPMMAQWHARKSAYEDAYFADRNNLGGAQRLHDWLTSVKPEGSPVAAHIRRLDWSKLPKRLRDALKHKSMRGPVNIVRGASQGHRNDLLLWAGCTAIRDGWMDEEGDEGWEALADAAQDAGLPDEEITTTLRSALHTEGQL